jgi:hypothetical protein
LNTFDISVPMAQKIIWMIFNTSVQRIWMYCKVFCQAITTSPEHDRIAYHYPDNIQDNGTLTHWPHDPKYIGRKTTNILKMFIKIKD